MSAAITTTTVRDQSLGEKVANALSHGLGCLLAVAALPVPVHNAARHGGATNIVVASLLAGTIDVLYFTSTQRHVLPPGRAKLWINQLGPAPSNLFFAGSQLLLRALRSARTRVRAA